MDLYLVSLATGAVGLGAMAVGGLSHAGAGHVGHGRAGVGYAGLGHGGVGHAGHAQAGQGHAGGAQAHAAHAHMGDGFRWTSLLSPRLVFALMVGFGAAGIAATPLAEPIRFGVAIAGAAAFELLLVGPIWRFLFRFESRPAFTLESAIEDEARAVTSFDANGNGLVAVDVDGQVVQLLATLAAGDRARGPPVPTRRPFRLGRGGAPRRPCNVTAAMNRQSPPPPPPRNDPNPATGHASTRQSP